MVTLAMSSQQISSEIDRIKRFISDQFFADDKAVIGVSGGLDSDIVVRLTQKAIGSKRIKLFTVTQDPLDPRHLENARNLASDMNINLVEIDLTKFPFDFMRVMQKADPKERFRPNGLLDPSRAKCSIRTVVFSTYQDRGYIVVGTSNRTEIETGFFLPFGDGISHIRLIAHLYKTQIRQIGKTLGTSQAVLEQPPSAGFWIDQEDVEDLAYWLYNEAPIAEEVHFDSNAEKVIKKIRADISIDKIDLALLCLSHGMEDNDIEKESGLPVSIIVRLRKLKEAAKRFKQRPLNLQLNSEV